jgi:U3 small nucleolar RNA-associated protein 14
MYVWWGRSKKKGRGTWVVGKNKERKKKKKKMKMWCTWVVGEKRKEKRKKKKCNNVIIKTKSKNQNYVPNTIFFFLNCDFSCETKTMYQTNFFLQF